MDNAHAVHYLERYGYVPPSKTASLVMPGGGLSRQMKAALQELQAFVGITQSGVLDKETLELMKKPRCGVKDFFQQREQTGW